MNYYQALQTTMAEEQKSTAYSKLTSQALEDGIAAISEELAGGCVRNFYAVTKPKAPNERHIFSKITR